MSRSLISEFIRPLQMSAEKAELLSVKPTFLSRSQPSSPRRAFLSEVRPVLNAVSPILSQFQTHRLIVKSTSLSLNSQSPTPQPTSSVKASSALAPQPSNHLNDRVGHCELLSADGVLFSSVKSVLWLLPCSGFPWYSKTVTWLRERQWWGRQSLGYGVDVLKNLVPKRQNRIWYCK